MSIVPCTKHTYRCNNGLCVSKGNPECDGKKDCSDGSDEKDCGEQGHTVVQAHTEAEITSVPHSPSSARVRECVCLEERMAVLVGSKTLPHWPVLVLEARP